MIYFTLDKILDEKNLSKYWLSKQTGIDNNTLGKIYNNESKQIKLETLDKICQVLNVTPNDLLKIDHQLNLFEIWEQSDSNKTLQVKEQIEDFVDNVDVEQLENRLNLEYKLINNLFLIIDNIINNADISEFPEVLKIDINKYKNWVNSVEASKFIFIYRVLYIIIAKQIRNNRLLNFITKMHEVYHNISIDINNNTDLEYLIDESEYLLSIFSSKQKD